jgi:mRNA-degrading endonuclease RelE of RelBE toxin-antitoxin system
MIYDVIIKKAALKNAVKMPQNMQAKLALLIDDLRDQGPVLPSWPNFSGIGKNCYHCHLGHKWVACWQWENEAITIEVYYAGSRENAPY